jgi:hypothetical protein
MTRGLRRTHEAVDYGELVRAYPPPPDYFEAAYSRADRNFKRRFRHHR